ncbi:hypothetical protein ACWC9T_27555 [Kitasatospora sp. NPDC001159]
MSRSGLSRRALIAGAGAAVVGWNAVARAWAAEPGRRWRSCRRWTGR